MYENIKVLRGGDFPLGIKFAGETLCDGKYYISRKESDLISMEYIVDGYGTLEINGQILHPKKGDVFLLTEKSEHKYYCDKDNPWHKYFVCFYGPLANTLIEKYLPKDTYLFENALCKNEFTDIFDIVFNNDDFDKINSLASVKLFKIFNLLYSKEINESEDLADRIKKMIDNSTTEEFNLDKLCEQINYSKNHIINIFSNKFDMTPYKYYKNSKIALAKEYLINTKMTVGEIASALSFGDQQYFSYSFKKETVFSPKKYREIMKV